MTIVVFGCMLFFTPGPAIVVVPVGLAILATEFLWARRLLGRFRDTIRARTNIHRMRPGAPASRIVSVALLCGACLYQLGWAWIAPVPKILGNITNDDAFLYLEFARNTYVFGFPTFDGITLTNGVQPLWGVTLVALASVIRDKILLLRCVLALCAILNTCAGLLMLKAASESKSRVTVLVIGTCWTCYMLGLSPSMLGMENSLHVLVIAMILLYLVRLYAVTSKPSWHTYALIGFLFALNAGARLDSVVVSSVLGVEVIRRGLSLV